MRGARELIVTAALGLAVAGCGAEAEPSAGRLQIPAIGVDTQLETLGLLADGRLAPPKDPHRAGLWRGIASGPRVIAGHVDTRTGPAVFARLPELGRGDRIQVDGARYVVTRTAQHPKDAFPTQEVYGGAGLRLITCTGIFDRASGHYTSNFVVFAEVERTRRAARTTWRAPRRPRRATRRPRTTGHRASTSRASSERPQRRTGTLRAAA